MTPTTPPPPLSLAPPDCAYEYTHCQMTLGTSLFVETHQTLSHGKTLLTESVVLISIRKKVIELVFFRIIWLRNGHGKTYISSGILLPSKVTHLVIKRPPHFHFRPGDYVFVNIPAIAKYEWHPFTLSSAPEQDDYMWLHIRGVGEWTNRLYTYFEKEQARLHQGEIVPSLMNSVPETGFVQTRSANPTPQKDFLNRNLEQMKKYQLQTKPNIENHPTSVTNEKENPFKFDDSKNARKVGTRKFSSESNILNPEHRMKLESESSSAIRKIQKTLHRTFSRKGTQDGYSNDGFIPDDFKNDADLKVIITIKSVLLFN